MANKRTLRKMFLHELDATLRMVGREGCKCIATARDELGGGNRHPARRRRR